MASPLKCILLGLALFLGTMAVVSIPGLAHAAELDKKAKADAKEATAYYKEGRYEEAARIFLRLGVANPDALVFVRNLGACYYYLRRAEPALSNLRDYVHRKKNIEDDDRAEVERWIREMELFRAEPTQPVAQAPVEGRAATQIPGAAPSISASPTSVPPAPSSPQTAYPAPTQTMPAGPASSAPSNPVQVGTAAQPTPAASNGYKTTAWILGITGVAGLGVGGVFTALAMDKFSTVEKKYDPAAEKDGKAYAQYQFIAYGAGAALLITGLVLGRLSPSAPSVAIVPTGNGMAGVLHGRF